jgi:hypothetical protein
MDINMLCMILAEFCAPSEDVAELALGAEHAVFDKLENRSGTCLVMEVQASTSSHCHYSRSSATSKVILNVQIFALAVL